MSQVHSITPVDKSGIIRCYAHGLVATLSSSQSERNPGRQYYCCSKSTNDPDRCAFWYWADDPMFKHLRHPSSSSPPAFPSNSSPCTHRVPPTTPQKRGFQPSLSSLELTPSQKRTKIMQEALQESSTSHHASTSGKSATSQRSQKRLDDIKQALSPKEPSNTPQLAGNSAGNASVEHASPSCPRFGQHSESTSSSQSLSTSTQLANRVNRQDSGQEDIASWALVTPPSSSLEIGSLLNERGTNAGSVYASEGNADPIDATPRWCSGDLENPFVDSISQSQATNSTSSSNPYVPASTSIQHSTSLSADTVSSLISRLGGIPDYMRKLERKVTATEKSNSAKARRIFDLEQEVGRLQEEKRALQESLNASKSKGH